jgi:hypothetical protein
MVGEEITQSQILGPLRVTTHSAGLELGLGICISRRFPGDSGAAGTMAHTCGGPVLTCAGFHIYSS